MDEKTCLKLLSKDVFEAGRIEKAFDKQDTDIALLNTTHSQFGPLFAACARITNEPTFRFDRNIIHAVDNAREKKKMIILCSESLSYNDPFELFAVDEEKETIENYGSRLDKIENVKKINTTTDEGFRSLVEEARKMN